MATTVFERAYQKTLQTMTIAKRAAGTDHSVKGDKQSTSKMASDTTGLVNRSKKK